MENKNEPPTMAIRNAGESANRKFRLAFPPKLRFDVLKKKGKTQSVALATVSAKLKGNRLENPHYA